MDEMPNSPQDREKFVQAYQRMMERVRASLEQAEKKTVPTIQKAVDIAAERASELGELTREEAEDVAGYLLRDLQDAARYISGTGRGLADWLRLDLLFVERNFLDTFSTMVDHTRLELDHLAERAAKFGEWHTGEMAGAGILQCSHCGEQIQFNGPGHVPPCPRCHGTVFKRVVGGS